MLALAIGWLPAVASRADDRSKHFESFILPVLVEHCYECHSVSAKILKGGLRLDSRTGWTRGGDSGPAIVPGQPDGSLLMRALRWQSDLHMPPKGRLPEPAIRAFEQWIADGAYDPRDETEPPAAEANPSSGARDHWAYQTFVPRISPPVGNPIDWHIGRKLRAKNLQPNEAADRVTLIRRMHFDLIGLPPTPQELNDYARLSLDEIAERLLASRHFGERWARHWLDVARFAESNGYEVDNRRRGAYQYRDWVIRAFNADLPFDRFARWQVAGDQLSPNDPDALIATGFIVAGTFSHPKPKAEQLVGRYDEIDDMVSTLSSAFLAQTVGCARCHDHKFEAIPQADYYALAAAFARTDRQRATLKRNGQSLRVDKLPERRGKEAPLPKDDAIAAYFASDYRKEPVHFLLRGDPHKPKEVARPGFLRVVARSAEPVLAGEEVHPRVALAGWLTDPKEGAGRLLARVMVNRLWHHYFGRGLVGTPNDFGLRGDRPTHPQLLDDLARTLIEEGWRLKSIHRLILQSEAWKRSAWPSEAGDRIDPENRLWWRQNIRRLEAEPLRDSLLAVAGLLERRPFGPGTLDARMRRRAIYFETKRTQLIPFLQAFNAPDSLTSIGRRKNTTVAPQALLLLNDPLLRECAQGLANTVSKEPDPVTAAYLRAYSRRPTEMEMTEAGQYLREGSLTDLCQALLLANEFLYVR